MHELLSQLDKDAILALSGMLVGVIAILGGISVAITAVVAYHFRKRQLDDMEATLKMEMIERGMSAGDIKQVLEARMGTRQPDTYAPPWKMWWCRMPDMFGGKCQKG